jgi:glycosyltransferase involved in cell wall biosynthesis
MVDTISSFNGLGIEHNDSGGRTSRSPMVSVILPTYNRPKWLEESVRSVLGQTFQDYEIIIVNDGGEDVSQIIQGFNDKRLIYLHHSQNLGLSAARNTGLRIARGKYIAYLDDDDIFYKDHLAILIGYLENHPENWVAYTDAVYSYLEKQEQDYVETSREVRYSNDFDRERMLYENYIPVLCIIHRKDCLERTGIFNPKLKRLEDWDLWVRMSRHYEFIHLKETTCEVRWRNDKSTMTSKGEEASFFAYLNIIHKNFNYLGKDARSIVNSILINKFEKYYDTLHEKILFNNLVVGEFFGIGQLNIVINQLKDIEEYSYYFLKLLALLYSVENNIHAYSEITSKIKDLEIAQRVDQEHMVQSLSVHATERDQMLSTQVAEKEQMVQSLSAQVAEKDQVVKSLSAQVAKKEQLAQTLSTQVADKDQMVQSVSAQVAEKDQTIQELQALLAVGEQQAAALQNQIAEREQETSNMNMQKMQTEQELGDLKDKLIQRETILQDLNTKLLEIYSSTAWKIIVIMWKVRLWLAPNNSKREKYGRKMMTWIRFSKIIDRKQKSIDTPKMVTYDNFVKEKNLLSITGQLPKTKATIVIPVYNALDYTKECLRSIYEFTLDIPIEIIVINNASTDGTREWLENEKSTHPNLDVITVDQNLGFGPAVNIGIKHSKGKFLVILNNDTIVSPGWLSKLIKFLDEDPAIGIISPVTNYVGEGPQIDQEARNLPASWDLIVKYSNSISNRLELFYEPNRLVFFCVVIRRELIDQIGDLDVGFENGNFEDDDYCLRARYAGFTLAIARNAFVYHRGSVTFNLNQISHTQWMENNRIRFYTKTGRISTSLRPSNQIVSKQRPITVSVIVRTKDRPNLLKNALTSLANQTFNKFEVILVNDGGEDVSFLIDEFNPYFSINYLCHKHSQGRTSAINTGLGIAKGKWIGYLDDDDILYPWHFEALMQATDNSSKVIFSDHNKALFECSDDLFPIRLVGAPIWNYNRQELLVQNFIPVHSYIHMHKCIDQIGLWNENLDRLEDYEFLIRLSNLSDFHHVRKVTCEYRYYWDVHSSITTVGRKEYLSALRKIYAQHEVKEQNLILSRQQIVEGLKNQIQQIEEILSKTSGMEAQKEIFRVITGL